MAKRRELKRDIAYVAGDLFTEVLFCQLYMPNIEVEKADQLMARVLDMRDEFTLRTAMPPTKDAKQIKDYFKKLRADIQTEVDAIATEIDALAGAACDA